MAPPISLPSISLLSISLPTTPPLPIILSPLHAPISQTDYLSRCQHHALFTSSWGYWTSLIYILSYICGIVLIWLVYLSVDSERKDNYSWARWWEQGNSGEVLATSGSGDVSEGLYGVRREVRESSEVVTGIRISMIGEENLKGGESGSRNPPPPYESSASNTQPQFLGPVPATAPIPTSTKSVKKPSEQFVKETLIFCLLMIDLFFQALAIQQLTYCDDDNRDKKKLSKGWVILWWSLCSPLYLGAFSSLLCWAILFRDLWGADSKKRFPIDPSCVWMFLFGLVVTAISSPAIIATRSYMGLVWCVESCQRGFCGGNAEEDEGEELESMEEGRIMVGGEEREEADMLMRKLKRKRNLD
ncbi:hypothetical protein SBOR_9170 [Sclerotinia borealis F-4128]|uniref:Transmembrane protein n=1 Tax=Sclerotinia borealis (strain F-4128) TaxID=1432307 RepID=W9C7B6_SCLBF|nr:hypothetical protein SBOR_9170 [Sclerotinia borealis F-4128]